ncbi:hypothetical protein V6N11_072490 [Hibiscus sabdariffa]|uniref:Uncharacterized protein n=1 Tax=Hibiscus sabdariffa TaxID=183260 RepID=A0ABR2U3H1_9ROSI
MHGGIGYVNRFGSSPSHGQGSLKLVKLAYKLSQVMNYQTGPKEARKVLKLGKRLGVEIIGDEQEVVKEIARLELGEAD